MPFGGIHLHLAGKKSIFHSPGEHSFSSSPCWPNLTETSCIICIIVIGLTVSTFAAAVSVPLIIAGENFDRLFTFLVFCSFT